MNADNTEIILLTDYRGAFWSSIQNQLGICSLDVKVLQKAFSNYGYKVWVESFSEVDLRSQNFNGKKVLYQSSEDLGLYYKDYLEDILLGIHLQGGDLIPPFHCFRAHHNKVFMEILRDLITEPELRQPWARTYGAFEDFRLSNVPFPVVLKRSWGAGSNGVRLAKNRNEALKIGKYFSKSSGLVEVVKEHIKRWLRRRYGYRPCSLYRNKFLVQEFLPGLTGDFKVLVYWDKYFVISRKNRKNDFRASGGGLLSWPEEVPDCVLDLARRAKMYFRVPMISLDIAMHQGKPVLLEFQFICFGTTAIERSNWFFKQQNGKWLKENCKSAPEEEFARSVISYLSCNK